MTVDKKPMDTKNFTYRPEHKPGRGGYYICDKCKSVADEKHNNRECHLCRNWNGCGDNCTLSSIYCKKCKIEDEITRH